MQATKPMERRNERQDSESQDKRESKGRNQAKLDARYGRIGISAVAAAVSHKGEAKPRHAAKSTHALRYERE
jgi:hypothetical protein